MNQSIMAHFQNVFINRVCTYAHYIQVILTFKMYHIYIYIYIYIYGYKMDVAFKKTMPKLIFQFFALFLKIKISNFNRSDILTRKFTYRKSNDKLKEM